MHKPYLLFDAGGTLVFPDFSYIAQVASGAGLSLAPERLFQAHCDLILDLDWPRERAATLRRILRALQVTPALQAAGERRQVRTNDDHRFYAFLRTSKDDLERALVVLNFQEKPQDVMVTLDRPACLREILSSGEITGGRKTSSEKDIQFSLPAYGYGIYRIDPVDPELRYGDRQIPEPVWT